MKVGLIGGSFDPVHTGHLRVAEEIRERLGIAEVIFVPARVSPHKRFIPPADSRHRLNMLELSVKDNPHFSVCDIELRRDSPSYTINTLRWFKENNPSREYYFIMGSEVFASIDKWKDCDKLLKYASFVIIRRPGFTLPPINQVPFALGKNFRYSYCENGIDVFDHPRLNRLFFMDISGVRVSSVEIRELVLKERSIKYLVLPEVERYIKQNDLYHLEK